MEQIEQQPLLLWRILTDNKYLHVKIPFLLCSNSGPLGLDQGG